MADNDRQEAEAFKAYSNPDYWDKRTALNISVPNLIRLYQDLNDNNLRKFLSKLDGLILDAGCGDGRFVNYASIGVDFSRGMLLRLKRVFPKKALVRASLLALPFKRHCFDCAFSIDVFIHIRPEERFLAQSELQRVSNKWYVFFLDRSVFSRILSVFKYKGKFALYAYMLLALVIAFAADRMGFARKINRFA